MPQKILPVDTFVDLVCPWCFIGFRRLLKAQKLVGDIELDIHFKPYLLNPDLPPAGRPYQAYLRQKLGDRENIDALHRELKKLGEDEGIEFDFEAIETMPDTVDAHRLVYWAEQAGKDIQQQVVAELFSRYFEEGQNIGDPAVLIDAAADAGMHAAVVEKLLQTGIDRQIIGDDAAQARQIGIRGVPCFIVDRKYAIMGAESAETLGDAIRQIANGFAPAQAEDR